MDKNEKYQLLTKVSEFYVNKVQKELVDLNDAKNVVNKSIFCIAAVAIFFIMIFIIAAFENKLGKSITDLAIVFICSAIFLLMIPMMFLTNKDQKSKYSVIKKKKRGNETVEVIPSSADVSIKKFLMQDFVKNFGDFEWGNIADSEITDEKVSFLANITKFIKKLNILWGYFAIDDFIFGKYKDFGVNIVEMKTAIGGVIFVIDLFIFIFSCAIVRGAYNIFILLVVISVLSLVVLILSQLFIDNFKGVVVELAMNKNFDTHTFILDNNSLKSKLRLPVKDYEIVKLEDPEFAEEYTVYSQNQIEARYILTTAFIERLKNIKKIFKAKYVRVAFKDNKIYLAINMNRDMFKMAGIKDINKETFIQLYEEICSILDLIDVLKLNKKLGL